MENLISDLFLNIASVVNKMGAGKFTQLLKSINSTEMNPDSDFVSNAIIDIVCTKYSVTFEQVKTSGTKYLTVIHFLTFFLKKYGNLRNVDIAKLLDRAPSQTSKYFLAISSMREDRSIQNTSKIMIYKDLQQEIIDKLHIVWKRKSEEVDQKR
jgi:hypothetical protein